MNHKVQNYWIYALVFVLLASACKSAPETTPAPPPTNTVEAAKPTDTPEPESGAIKNLQDVKKAIIQIESQGTFVDPEFGLVLNGAGRGSGFIIDPSGLAVTNNHVVTGAALLKVWVGGETESRNARVLGVSECSDLAVIDIEGDGYEFLEWFDGAIDVGMDMYIAGFPLGDPEYTLTKGVVSKARASGETSWASVDSVVEYDATSNPGNSGGPVVNPDGKVLAVHYAGNSQTRQAFGISRDIASDIIEDLKSGKNVDTMGINGQAVSSEDGSLTGIWVSSVQSGSAADNAGIEPADILLSLEGLILATDGSYSQYCDILRSHNPGDTLSVEVLRWTSGEYLEGQLNGRALEVTGVLDSGTSSDTGDSGTTDSGSTAGVVDEGGVYYNPNASQSGDIVYSTTFDSPINDWRMFLTLGTESNFSYEVSNGRLRTDIRREDTYVYYFLEGVTFNDTRVDITVENMGANTNWVGVICRASDEGWYETNILSTGEYSVWRYDPARRSPYVMMWSAASTLIRTKQQSNQYTVICSGDQITLYINNSMVKSVPMKSAGYGMLRDGQVGITVQAIYALPVILEFDEFTVSLP